MVGQNSMSAILMSNIMANPFCGYPITPGGFDTYAMSMSTNPTACNPMMAATMNVGMIVTNHPNFAASFRYGLQMIPSSESIALVSLGAAGLGFGGGIRNKMNNQPVASRMTDEIANAHDLPSFDGTKGKVDGEEEEEEDPKPW